MSLMLILTSHLIRWNSHSFVYSDGLYKWLKEFLSVYLYFFIHYA